MSKITIIGAGNGGVTAAYHFSSLGHQVCLFDQESFSTQIDAIKEHGGIKAHKSLKGTDFILGGFQKIEVVTTDMKTALEFSQMIVVIVPSFAQEILFERMLPFLTNQHIIFTMPGNYASLVMEHMKKILGYQVDLTYVDAMTIPWACRLFDPGTVGIMGIKAFIYAGVFPSRKTKETLALINEFFPIEVKSLTNVIEAGLENINFGGHPLVTTLNIGLLENFKGQFNYYSDCVSPSTDRVSEKMENERLMIGASLGLKLKPELEMMNELYESHAESVYEFNKGSETHSKIHTAPSSASSRYITEDVPNILVPCYEFAKLFNLEVPIIESCIHIASAYNKDNYFDSGRTLDKMGLEGMTYHEIIKYVNQ